MKHFHMTFACLTVLGFLIRVSWLMLGSALLNAKPTKILPHIIDTCLLISGLGLMVKTGFYPTIFLWMAIKLLLVLLYIANGFFVLKLAKTNLQRLIGLMISLFVVVRIVYLAHFKPLI